MSSITSRSSPALTCSQAGHVRQWACLSLLCGTRQSLHFNPGSLSYCPLSFCLYLVVLESFHKIYPYLEVCPAPLDRRVLYVGLGHPVVFMLYLLHLLRLGKFLLQILIMVLWLMIYNIIFCRISFLLLTPIIIYQKLDLSYSRRTIIWINSILFTTCFFVLLFFKGLSRVHFFIIFLPNSRFA